MNLPMDVKEFRKRVNAAYDKAEAELGEHPRRAYISFDLLAHVLDNFYHATVNYDDVWGKLYGGDLLIEPKSDLSGGEMEFTTEAW